MPVFRAFIATIVASIFVAAAAQPACARYGYVSTVAGSGGTSGRAGDGDQFSGDGGPARKARFSFTNAVVALPKGGFLILDGSSGRVRRVWRSGKITTVAGCGAPSSVPKANKCAKGLRKMGDGGPATRAKLHGTPFGLRLIPGGGYLIADVGQGYSAIRKVSRNGRITTVAGTQVDSFVKNSCQFACGDGGPAIKAGMIAVGVSPTRDGGFLIADWGNDRIRRVDPNGIIRTVAGNGWFGRNDLGNGRKRLSFSGDGGPATLAELDKPTAVQETEDGGFLIADTGNNRIRKVTPDGIIRTLVGSGPVRAPRRSDRGNILSEYTGGFSGDGGLATAARINAPHGIALDRKGGFYFADTGNNRIRHVNRRGIIRTVVGSGRGLPLSDKSMPARRVALSGPWDVSLARNGDLLIADTTNHRIRRLDLHSTRSP